MHSLKSFIAVLKWPQQQYGNTHQCLMNYSMFFNNGLFCMVLFLFYLLYMPLYTLQKDVLNINTFFVLWIHNTLGIILIRYDVSFWVGFVLNKLKGQHKVEGKIKPTQRCVALNTDCVVFIINTVYYVCINTFFKKYTKT